MSCNTSRVSAQKNVSVSVSLLEVSFSSLLKRGYHSQ